MSKVYEYVTDRILKALNAGTVPWNKPWNGSAGLARNGTSGWVYRGINVWMTSLAGYSSPFWFSKTDIGKQKGKIRKGEKATIIVFFKMLKSKDKTKTGKDKSFPMLKYFNVWNLEQLDGVEPTKRAGKAAEEAFSDIGSAEDIIKNSPVRPSVRHSGSKACYSPQLDSITMPAKDDFDSAESYYSVLFHEFGHATGHKDRLDRDLSGLFGDHSYTKEELIAEMTSVFLCGVSGIDTDGIVNNSAAYLNSWRRKISADPRLIVSAASAAQKAADKVLGTEFGPAKKKDAEEAKELVTA